MPPRDFSADLRKLLHEGASLDGALEILRVRGASVIESMMAVREVRSCDLGEAKRLVVTSPVWSAALEWHKELVEELERAAAGGG